MAEVISVPANSMSRDGAASVWNDGVRKSSKRDQLLAMEEAINGGKTKSVGDAAAMAAARGAAGGLYPSKAEFVFACSYNNLDNLAHQPTGTPAKHALSLYSLDHDTGRLTLMTLTNSKKATELKALENPAFARCHPKKDVVYVVTESVKEKGILYALGVCPITGKLRELGTVTTGGRSACYISLSYDLRYLLIVNYWDSTMVSVPIDENGEYLFRLDEVPHLPVLLYNF